MDFMIAHGGILLGLGLLIAAAVLVVGIETVVGTRTIRFLIDEAAGGVGELPPVSIIFAARDEERKISEALSSLLKQDYPDYEILAVDDRSTDRTGAILDEAARDSDRLRVLHLSTLPEGWLGKNHALHQGFLQARGALLLFTDADIVMAPDTLTKAVAAMRRHGYDHVTVSPRLSVPGLMLQIFVSTFTLFFAVFQKPWNAKKPGSRNFIGIGAFNLVRREAYESAGTHKAIALRPDDDVKLGKIIKRGGYRQDVFFGDGQISVEWYRSVGEAVRGLDKNGFAGIEYNWAVTLASSAALLLIFVFPWAALFLAKGPAWGIYCGIIAAELALFAFSARHHGTPPWHAPALPLGVALFVYIVLRSAVLNTVHKGITWRGTHYPLDLLKSNRV